MFQITVSASHPVKANGLEKVIKQFGEGCTTSNLIFVVPKGTEDTFRTQRYVTKTSEQFIGRLPACVKEVKQWVAGMPIEHSTESAESEAGQT